MIVPRRGRELAMTILTAWRFKVDRGLLTDLFENGSLLIVGDLSYFRNFPWTKNIWKTYMTSRSVLQELALS